MAEAKPAVSAKGRQAGDYSPPILAPAKGGPVPAWNGDSVASAPTATMKTGTRPMVVQLELPLASGSVPDFGQIRDDWDTARIWMLDHWPDAATALVDGLAVAAAAFVAAGDLAGLGGLAAGMDIVEPVVAALLTDLTPVAVASTVLVSAEAAAHGVAVPEPDDLTGKLEALAAFAAAQIAAGYAQAASRKALTLAGSGVEATLRMYLNEISTARSGLVADAFGAALTAAQNAGRAAVLSQLTGVVWVADEHLDDATCEPCKATDGTEYESWDAAHAAYPVVGNAGCLGSGRCRGLIRIQLPA